MSSKVKSLENSIKNLHSEFSEIKSIVVDIKDFFDKWMKKQNVDEEPEENSDEEQSSESEGQQQQQPLGWISKDKKRFKEKLRVKTIELEKLETEIQQLNVSLSLLKDLENEELRKKLDAMMMDLRNKEISLHELEEFNKTLIIKKRKSNKELRCARKILIKIIKEISPKNDHVGVKKTGELITKPFVDAMKKRYTAYEAKIRGAKLYSLWIENIKDPNWNPFEVVFVDGIPKQVIINDEDNKLIGLKLRIGSVEYNDLVAALIERSKHNHSGACPILKLWNYEEKRKATLEEGIKYLLNYQSNKRKRKNVMSQVGNENQVDLEGSANDEIVMEPQPKAKRNVDLPKRLQDDYVLTKWKKTSKK